MKSVDSDIYKLLGASSEKKGVKVATKNVPQGINSTSFCRIFQDLENRDKCLVAHSDGSGTKSLVAYLDYVTNINPFSFEAIGHDSLIMNLDDVLCCGFTDNFQYVSTINRNFSIIGDDVIQSIINGTLKTIEELKKYGINIIFCGGETADVGDICKTILVDGSIFSNQPTKNIITNELKKGHVIVGLSSFGKATYEYVENSGIGSNGISLARKAILNNSISKDEHIKSQTPYFGKYNPNDKLPNSSLTALSALLSPTRTYAPIIKEFLKNNRKNVSGIIHNTGGGQLKCINFAQNVKIKKTIPYPFPVIFQEIQASANISDVEMAKVFNLGWRMEVYCSKDAAEKLIQISKQFKVDAKIIGYVGNGDKELDISINGDTYSF